MISPDRVLPRAQAFGGENAQLFFFGKEKAERFLREDGTPDTWRVRRMYAVETLGKDGEYCIIRRGGNYLLFFSKGPAKAVAQTMRGTQVREVFAILERNPYTVPLSWSR